MKKEDPENPAILEALTYADKQKELFLASAEASTEIEETKRQLEKLKQEVPREKAMVAKIDQQEQPLSQSKPATAEPSDTLQTELIKGQEIAQLETKLVKLTETLKQLEEMKQELEEERKKTTILSEELSEKESRERDLLSQLEKAKKDPPVIVVATPRDGTELEIGTVVFSGVAEDDQGLKALEIFINNTVIETEVSRDIRVATTKPPRRLEFTERIPLKPGKNEISVLVTDTDGLTAERALSVHYHEMRTNVWAVIIGIDNYQKNRHLKYAVSDARAFYDHLIQNNRIPRENVTLMVDEEATFARLRSTLGTHLKNKAGKEDMVIIYFAGHGACEKDAMSPDGDGLEKYILPCDADPKDLYGSALPMSEVSRIFNRISSERLIFIADACYSGASGGRTIRLTGIRSNLSDAFLNRIASGKGRVILTASGPNEISAEDDKFGHGIFTYFLLEGLRGKADTDEDGIITVDEVYRYVSREVPRATDQGQHPVKKGIVEGQLILSVID
jgi:hypothetical protein